MSEQKNRMAIQQPIFDHMHHHLSPPTGGHALTGTTISRLYRGSCAHLHYHLLPPTGGHALTCITICCLQRGVMRSPALTSVASKGGACAHLHHHLSLPQGRHAQRGSATGGCPPSHSSPPPLPSRQPRYCCCCSCYCCCARRAGLGSRLEAAVCVGVGGGVPERQGLLQLPTLLWALRVRSKLEELGLWEPLVGWPPFEGGGTPALLQEGQWCYTPGVLLSWGGTDAAAGRTRCAVAALGRALQSGGRSVWAAWPRALGCCYCQPTAVGCGGAWGAWGVQGARAPAAAAAAAAAAVFAAEGAGGVADGGRLLLLGCHPARGLAWAPRDKSGWAW
eukprot:1158410-Pelagomonas_calceolata.AAC.4